MVIRVLTRNTYTCTLEARGGLEWLVATCRPGDPGEPSLAGDRAPPRGVDVKPLPARGLPGSWEVPDQLRTLSGRAPRGRGPGSRGPGSQEVSRPGRGSPETGSGVPEGPGHVRGRSALGGFTSTPRAGALRLRPGDLGTRVPGTRISRVFRRGPQEARISPSAISGDRAPPRGVDVKPPPPGGSDPGNPDFSGFLRIFPIFGQNRGFPS